MIIPGRDACARRGVLTLICRIETVPSASGGGQVHLLALETLKDFLEA